MKHPLRKVSAILIVSVLLTACSTDFGVPQPTQKVVAAADLTAICTLDAEQLRISCQANGYQEDSQLTWTSTAAWSYGGGSQWEFTINDELIAPTAEVFLEECRGTTCQTVVTTLDTSIIVPSQSASPDASTDTDFRMRLPFAEDDEPFGIMPMGETIQHPIPGGHPGWDFQWDHQATIIAVADGEVAEIVSSVHTETGIFNYSVSVITGEFIVEYTTLETVPPDVKVGGRVVVGQVIGRPTPVQKGHQTYMIHWDFGTYEKHEPRANPEGQISEYEVTKICPVPYFTESERQRIFRLWKTASYAAKDQFPDLCNDPWKNYSG